MARRTITQSEVAEVVKLAKDGKHLREICRLSGVSQSGVSRITAELGIRLARGKPGAVMDFVRVRAVKLLSRTIHANELATLLGCSQAAISNDLKLFKERQGSNVAG